MIQNYLFAHGAAAGIRTPDRPVNSRALYQLSYGGSMNIVLLLLLNHLDLTIKKFLPLVVYVSYNP